MAFDSARNRTVLFGGMGSTGELSDTWEWNGTAWSPISTPMPPARAFHGLAYDSARQRTVLFGGANLAGLLGGIRERTLLFA